MIKIKSTNTILYCEKWHEVVSFYQSLLNLPVITSLDWFIEFKLSDTARLSIADASKTSLETNEGRGITLTFEVDNIQSTHAELIQKGFAGSAISDHSWGAQVIHIFDPEGNRVEFWAAN